MAVPPLLLHHHHHHHLLLLLLILLLDRYGVHAVLPRSVDTPSSWINAYKAQLHYTYEDTTQVRSLLETYTNSTRLNFALGFLRNSTTPVYYLVVIKVPSQPISDHGRPPIILWCANRDRPVQENATLDFTTDGDLILRDADGSSVWSTNTFSKSITNMTLGDDGCLSLVKGNGGVVWDSFRDPTDTWVPGQSLRLGSTLASAVTASNLSTGMFYLRVTARSIRGYLNWEPPKQYSSFSLPKNHPGFSIGSLNLLGNYVTYESQGGPFQYMRLEPNGHLNVYQLLGDDGYQTSTMVTDLLRDVHYGDCSYPTICGSYGVCTDEHCSCPGSTNSQNTSYFRQTSTSDGKFGCAEVTPLSCNDAQHHAFLELDSVSYFDLSMSSGLLNTDAESCKKECLHNCSCKAVFFRYRENISLGNCSLQFQPILSLMTTNKALSGYNDVAFIKVQEITSPTRKKPLLVILAAALSLILLFIAIGSGIFCFFCRSRKKMETPKKIVEDTADENCSVQLTNLLIKFSFEDLKSVTQNFQIKLGQGGCGSVFEGTLPDGTKVAVKHLVSNIHQGKKTFLAEVQTIGSIHHINLVRLVGYCAERSDRLLVYEHMCNGSLDAWIFHPEAAKSLDWGTRWDIVVGIAKGLEYLHDHCNSNIVHFDIKPQNILLDKDFNVKIADFGLASLVQRDKTHVSTFPKGTPGYMAPEIIRGQDITVKVDMYSLGVVILEIISGRRNLYIGGKDSLIETVRRRAEEGRLADIVDQRDKDMQRHIEEAVDVLNIAILCLQDVSRRPTASKVVKMLEGLVALDYISNYDFLDPFHLYVTQVDRADSSRDSDSILLSSGPR